MEKKTMLITGHRGLLGSACVRHFSEDFNVITSGMADLRIHDQVLDLFARTKPEVVIHCAAKVGGVKSNKEEPVEFLTENLKMQTNVISLAADFNVSNLVFIGTSCMFPRDATCPVSEDSLLTGKLEDSVEAYAIAKIAGWRLCKAHFEQYGRHFITVNPSNIYGRGDNYSDRAHVIPALIRRAVEASMKGEPLKVWGDGSAIREFIYVDDVASAIDTALNFWHSPEVLSIGTGVSTTIQELAEMIVDLIPGVNGVEWDKSKPTGIPRKTFNIDRLSSLEWSPRFTLREGLVLAIQDYFARF